MRIYLTNKIGGCCRQLAGVTPTNKERNEAINMHHKVIYQKKNGQYFWAPSDDYTRTAYAEMGIRITNKEHVSSIVMAPTLPRQTKTDKIVSSIVNTWSDSNVSPLVVKEIGKLMSEVNDWQGTSSDLLAACPRIDDNPTSLSLYLFKPDTVDLLKGLGITIGRKRIQGKRILVLSR